MNQLVMSGQSFGGVTAIKVAATLGQELKACLALDPWLFAHWDKWQNGTLKVECPLQVISTQEFHPIISTPDHFPSWETVKALFTHAD